MAATLVRAREQVVTPQVFLLGGPKTGSTSFYQCLHRSLLFHEAFVCGSDRDCPAAKEGQRIYQPLYRSNLGGDGDLDGEKEAFIYNMLEKEAFDESYAYNFVQMWARDGSIQ